jgi:hypothetical protein
MVERVTLLPYGGSGGAGVLAGAAIGHAIPGGSVALGIHFLYSHPEAGSLVVKLLVKGTDPEADRSGCHTGSSIHSGRPVEDRRTDDPDILQNLAVSVVRFDRPLASDYGTLNLNDWSPNDDPPKL